MSRFPPSRPLPDSLGEYHCFSSLPSCLSSVAQASLQLSAILLPQLPECYLDKYTSATFLGLASSQYLPTSFFISSPFCFYHSLIFPRPPPSSLAVPAYLCWWTGGCCGCLRTNPHFITWQTPGSIVQHKEAAGSANLDGARGPLCPITVQASTFYCWPGTQRNPGPNPAQTVLSIPLAGDRPRALLAASLG